MTIDWSQMQTAEQKAEEATKAERELWKAQRAENVSRIKVTTSTGKVFDGDEVSQGRMARAILALQAAEEGTTTQWVLADNTEVQVSITELIEALQLAGQKQTELWVPNADS